MTTTSWIVMIAQAAASTGEPAPPMRIDLLPRRKCASDRPEDIVVCAREAQSYRLEPLPEKYEEPVIPPARASVLGGEGAVEVEQGEVGGIPSKRVMGRMKWRF